MRAPVVATVVVVVLGLLAAAALAAGRVGREQPVPGGQAVDGLVADGPLTLLPEFAETPNSRDVSGLLYRGLTRTGPDGKPAPELARSWAADQAAKTFTLRLRPGLRWSDGAPLTSEDALYTLAVLQSDAAARSIMGQAWAGITASAPDPLTVIYVLPQSNGAFVALTTIGLLPEHALKPRAFADLRRVTDAPTSGPFRVGHVSRDEVLLERNPHAFERPYLDGLELRVYDSRPRAISALMSGDVDVVQGLTPDEAASVAGAVNRQVLGAPSFAYSELLANQKNGNLADDHVRQAVEQAIDRPAIIAGPLRGRARHIYGPVPPAISWAAVPARAVAADSAAASRTLDAAGWKRQGTGRVKDGQKLELRLASMEGSPYAGVAALVDQELSAVGIRVVSSALSQESMLSRLQAHDFDLALTALDNGPDPDIYALWHSSQTGPGGFNFSGMPANAALDKDLEDGRATADYAGRRKAYVDAQKQVVDAHAAVFLYSPDILVGARSALRGVVVPTGGELFDLVQGWYFNSTRRL